MWLGIAIAYNYLTPHQEAKCLHPNPHELSNVVWWQLCDVKTFCCHLKDLKGLFEQQMAAYYFFHPTLAK